MNSFTGIYRRFCLDFRDTLSWNTSDLPKTPHNVLKLIEFMSIKLTYILHYFSTYLEKIQRQDNLVIHFLFWLLALSKVEIHLSQSLPFIRQGQFWLRKISKACLN